MVSSFISTKFMPLGANHFCSFTPPVVLCSTAFLLGLLFVQPTGNYFVTMFDDYSAGLPLTVIALLENLSVAWIYGGKR